MQSMILIQFYINLIKLDKFRYLPLTVRKCSLKNKDVETIILGKNSLLMLYCSSSFPTIKTTPYKSYVLLK